MTCKPAWAVSRSATDSGTDLESVVRFKEANVAKSRNSPESRTSDDNGFRMYRSVNNGFGWLVNITVDGIKYCKYFADATFGSTELARAAAEAVASRDKAIHEELLVLRRRLKVRKNCKSGHPGVGRFEGDKTHAPNWAASWVDSSSGRRLSKRFYVAAHGEEAARELAIEARHEATQIDQARLEQLLNCIKERYGPSGPLSPDACLTDTDV